MMQPNTKINWNYWVEVVSNNFCILLHKYFDSEEDVLHRVHNILVDILANSYCWQEACLYIQYCTIPEIYTFTQRFVSDFSDQWKTRVEEIRIYYTSTRFSHVSKHYLREGIHVTMTQFSPSVCLLVVAVIEIEDI